MGNLILNAIKKSKEREVLLESAGSFLGGGKFDSTSQVPIEPESSTWQTLEERDKTCIRKVFNFKSMKHIRYFLDEILREADRIFHDPKILIDGKKVEVELYTHDINDISSLDVDMSKFIDEIFGEIKIVLDA